MTDEQLKKLADDLDGDKETMWAAEEAILDADADIRETIIDDYPEEWFVKGVSGETLAIVWEEYRNQETCETQGADGGFDLIKLGSLSTIIADRKAELLAAD